MDVKKASFNIVLIKLDQMFSFWKRSIW